MERKTMLKKWIPFLGVCLIVAGILGFTYMKSKEENSGGLHIEKNTVAWDKTLDKTNEQEGQSIQIPYYPDINVEKKDAAVTLVNPKENPCYFTYTFFRQDTGEKIYQSGLLEPGKAIDGMKLDKELKTGVYQISILINTYSLDDRSPMNNATVKTKLVVS